MDSATKQKRYRERKRQKEHIRELLYRLVYDEMVTLLNMVERYKQMTTVKLEVAKINDQVKHIRVICNNFNHSTFSPYVFYLLLENDLIEPEPSLSLRFGEYYKFK